MLSHSEEETERWGEELARDLGGRATVLLEGGLGSGKTVLVRGMARALGVDPREVQSPTYTLIHEYEGTANLLVHVDLYRLEPDEIESLGLEEILAGPGIKAIEWAERLPHKVTNALRVTLVSRDDRTREIRLFRFDRKETT